MTDKSGNELFYLDKDGKKQDAALHEEMLNSITPEDAANRHEANRALGKRLGFPQKMIDQHFPPAGYARGGSVKVLKASVNYSKGMEKSHCGICQFYHAKTCSKVQGPIDWSMWCKLYKAKE